VWHIRLEVSTGLLRRTLPLAVPGVALLILFTSPWSQAPASSDPQSFTPAFVLGVSSTATAAHAAVTLTTTLPAGNHRLGQAFYLVPKLWGVAGDAAIQNGDTVGSVSFAADLNCDGFVEPPLTANLTEVNDPDNHAHWNATLGPPLNLTLQFLVEVNVDDPDVDYDIAVAVFPNNPPSPCNPMTFVTTINGLSGLGVPVLSNPNPARTYLWQAIYLSAPVFPPEHIVGRYVPVCIGDPDGDSDGVCNAQDNCPSVMNPDQGDANTNGTGDACDASDTDGDGFQDRTEYSAGTDRSAACAASSTHNAWPPDFNNDRFVTGSDLNVVASNIGKTVPPAAARNDIAPDPPDGSITGADLSRVASAIGRTCGVAPTPTATATPTATPTPTATLTPTGTPTMTPTPTPGPGDQDGDGVLDPVDNCPTIYNPDQRNVNPVDGVGDACDPDDFDLDFFSDRIEYFAGTDPGADCATTSTHNAWPPDFNNDRSVTGSDLNVVSSNIGKTVPPAAARINIAPDPPDGSITGGDLAAVSSRIGETCAP